MNEVMQSIIVGLITGAFSGGAVYGVLKTELAWLRRDVNEIRDYIWDKK